MRRNAHTGANMAMRIQARAEVLLLVGRIEDEEARRVRVIGKIQARAEVLLLNERTLGIQKIEINIDDRNRGTKAPMNG